MSYSKIIKEKQELKRIFDIMEYKFFTETWRKTVNQTKIKNFIKFDMGGCYIC